MVLGQIHQEYQDGGSEVFELWFKVLRQKSSKVGKSMKEFIFVIVASVLRLTGRIKFRLFRGKKAQSALILLPSEAGSLGDDAILTGTLTLLKRKGIGKFGLITYVKE